MPAEYVEFGRSWERLHPGWEVITWGDDDLDWLANRAEFDRAERYTTKANIARYEIIHREGGLYVDCDFEPLRPIDELLVGASLVVGEDRGGMMNNAFFAASAGHPVLAYAIEELPRSFAARFHDHSVANTGPQFWTRCVRRASVRYEVTPTMVACELIYPYGFDPGQRHLRHADLGDAYAVHHWADDARLASAGLAPSGANSHTPEALFQTLRTTTKRVLSRHVKPWVQALTGRLSHLPGPWVWGTYVGNNRVLVRTTSGLPMLAFADDLGVTPMLLANGEFDPGFVRLLRHQLARGDVVVDVGANIGLFTIEMARQVGKTGLVHAFESNPEVHELLQDNVYLNRVAGHLAGEVRCRAVAVGSTSGSAIVRARTTHRGVGSLTTPDGGPAPGGADEIEVPVVSLDAELAGLVEIKLVKIDVEGSELAVLLGMDRLLRERRVRMIDLELIDRHAGASWEGLACELRRLQADLGGRFHRIDRAGRMDPIDVEEALHLDGLRHLVIVLPPA
jgi:FkbM family methyltransferase